MSATDLTLNFCKRLRNCWPKPRKCRDFKRVGFSKPSALNVGIMLFATALAWVSLVVKQQSAYSQSREDTPNEATDWNRNFYGKGNGPKLADSSLDTYWEILLKNPPNFGVVVKDDVGIALEMFDLNNAVQAQSGQIEIPGYSLPPGARIERVGVAGWWSAAEALRSGRVQQAGFGSTLIDTAEKINEASALIKSVVCEEPGYPTEIVLSFDASFTLVVGAGAGTKLTWDMKDVCSREQSK